MNSSPNGMPRGGRAKPPDTPTGGPMKRTLLFSALVPLLAWAGAGSSGPEDESVFVTGLRAGQHESLLYVWTSDADAKDPDFLSVVDADTDGNSRAGLPAPERRADPREMAAVGGTPERNRLIRSGGTHAHRVGGDRVAPESVGDAVVVWDWKAGKVLQVPHLEKMP